MTMEQLDRIEAGIKVLLDRAMTAPPGTPPGAPALVHPGPNGLAVVGGWVFAIDEPIAADWRPTMLSVEMAARYGRIGADPSNAFNSGLPKRSPSGYPLFYAVGAYGPVPPGRILWGESTFASEQELAEHRAAEAAQHRDNSPFSPGGPR